jgi:hypothetical protein
VSCEYGGLRRSKISKVPYLADSGGCRHSLLGARIETSGTPWNTKRLPSTSMRRSEGSVPTDVSADPDTSAERDGQSFDEGCEGHVEVDSGRTHDPHLASPRTHVGVCAPALGSSVRSGPVLAARSTHHCNGARAPGRLGGYVTSSGTKRAGSVAADGICLFTVLGELRRFRARSGRGR